MPVTPANRSRWPRWRAGLFALVLVAGLLLGGPFLVPVPPLAGLVPAESLAEPDSQFVAVAGLRVHVKVSGAGQPGLLLIHGFTASTFTWRAVTPALAEAGTVIAFGRPGFGLTERPLTWAGPSPYTPEAATDLMVGLLDHFGVERAVLVGSSAGGALAAYAALRYPERVAALVLLDAPVFSAGGGSPPALLPVLNAPQMRHLGPLIARAFIGNLPDFVRGFWYRPERVTPAIIAAYQRPFTVEDWDRAFWEVFANSRALELGPRVPEITQPVLVLTGAQDAFVPSEQSQRLAAALPRAEYAALPDCGHLPQEECPGPAAAAIVEFIRRLP